MFSLALTINDPSLSEDDIYILGQALSDLTPVNTAIKNESKTAWIITWFCQDEPPETPCLTSRLLIQSQTRDITLPSLSNDNWEITPVEEKNWLEECYQGFQPFAVGPFYLYGSHYDGEIPRHLMAMQIDAATAFGSGEHGTTKGCMLAMMDLKNIGVCPWNVLDLGCGSGILTIAAWKLWQTPVLGTDIDPESIVVSERHALINKVPMGKGKVRFEQGDGIHAEVLKRRAPYELIIANILAGPLKEMAADICAVVEECGYIILSGMREEQAADVLAVYEPLGCALKKRYDLDGWSTLVLWKT